MSVETSESQDSKEIYFHHERNLLIWQLTVLRYIASKLEMCLRLDVC